MSIRNLGSGDAFVNFAKAKRMLSEKSCPFFLILIVLSGEHCSGSVTSVILVPLERLFPVIVHLTFGRTLIASALIRESFHSRLIDRNILRILAKPLGLETLGMKISLEVPVGLF